MTQEIKLLPCPFCGGDAELDSRQGYRALVTGRTGNRVTVYCRDCAADMGVCIEDVPDIEPEQVADMWNRRAAVEADRQQTQALLSDPVHVHTNMCRGLIAPITFDMLAHVLGDEVTVQWISSRAGRTVPSDEELLALLEECGALTTAAGIRAIRTALSRYGQPAASEA